MRYIVTVDGERLDIETSFSHEGEVHELIRDDRSIKWNLKSIAPQVKGIETRDLIAIIDVLTSEIDDYIIDKLGIVKLDIEGEGVKAITLTLPIYKKYNQEDDMGIIEEYVATIVRKKVIRGM